MTIKNRAFIVGAYEHPTRHAPDKSLVQLHAEVAIGALADAELSKNDIDAYYFAGDASGLSTMSMVDYLNLKVRHVDSTEAGGTSVLALSAVPFDRLGMKIDVPRQPLPLLTWQILSKVPSFVAVWGVLLFGIHWITKRRDEVSAYEAEQREKRR